ncbi:hypothetical protein EWM64_g10498 [Hericium alpestre]|uniref:UBX domain-containing protein n=1 Tax=Hericium alpestre TaxID=135208 RepID=A0A4Y9ZGH3_9AGAM|nr:hypothetical protein EWM64_g10498 [Hericium alpestre]
MSDRDTLLSMGFDTARVDWALRATSNRGLQPAMDFILEHNDDPIPDPSAAPPPAASSQGEPMDEDEDLAAIQAAYGKANIAPASGTPDAEGAEAKSIKCSQCGKVFKNTALANYHAEKSGHDQFEESVEELKPLTEEEKKQKLEELRVRMTEKRAKKAAADAKEAQANEAIRRKGGRDMGEIKEDMEKKQALKDAEAKRRAAAPAPSAAAATPAPAVAGKDFKETRLQIRLASGGQPYTTTLPSESTLLEVAEYLAGQTLSVDVETVTLAQHFPRKQFSRADFSRTLRELGLTPSAVCRISVICIQKQD